MSDVRRVVSEHPSRGGTRADYAWPALCALLLAAPFLVVSMPPMVDFPAHEAVVGVLRHRGDASFFPPDLYVSNWGHPNQLQYLLAWPLSYALGTTRALEAVVALAVASVVLGAARLGRHLGRPAWVGVLVAPAAIGWSLGLGLIASLLGLGLLLAMLPDLDAFARAPRWRRVPAVLAGFALLYVAHEGALATAMLALAILSIAHGGSLAAYALRAVPCAAAVAGALVQLSLQHLTQVNAASLYPIPLAQRVWLLPWTLVGFADADEARPVFAIILALVALNAARALRAPGRASSRARDRRSWHVGRETLVRARFVVFGLVLLAAYFVLPASGHGVFYLFHRFFTMAWCVLVVASAAPEGAPYERLARWACAAVPAIMLAHVGPALLASDASYRRLDALLPAVDEGSGVFSAELDRDLLHAFNPQWFSTRFAQGHVVALRGGRALADYTQSPISPALVNPAFAWQDAATSEYVDPNDFHTARVLARFRYVILHSTFAPRIDVAVGALAGEARVVARAADWVILESTILETRRLDVPEPSVAGLSNDTLAQAQGRLSAAPDAPPRGDRVAPAPARR